MKTKQRKYRLHTATVQHCNSVPFEKLISCGEEEKSINIIYIIIFILYIIIIIYNIKLIRHNKWYEMKNPNGTVLHCCTDEPALH